MADTPLLITSGDITGALKNVYESFRINAFPKLTVLLSQVKRARPGGPERMTWGGNGVFWDVVLDRPVGMVASDLGHLPNSSAARERQATLGIKRTYVSRQIDALAIKGTASKEASFVPLVRKVVQEALDAAQLGQQEILHGDGKGIKAIVDSVTSTTEIVVDDPYGIANAGQGGLLVDVGMEVAVLDTSASDAVLGRSKINSVTHSSDLATLVLATAITGMAAGDKLVATTDQDTSFNGYPNGLVNITNRGNSYANFESIDAATFKRWDATRFVAGTDTPDATQPTEMDVWKLSQVVAGKSGKDAKAKSSEFLLMTTPGVERKLAESFLGQRRWEAGSSVTLKGGFKAINLFGLPLVSDSWCPKGTLYSVHIPSLTWVDLMDWVKLSYEDAGAWRFITKRDAYEVNFGAYWNFGGLQRNTHGSITGYEDDDRYTHVMG